MKDRPPFQVGEVGSPVPPRHIPRWLHRLILDAHMYIPHVYVWGTAQWVITFSGPLRDGGVVSRDSHVMVYSRYVNVMVAGTSGMGSATCGG